MQIVWSKFINFKSNHFLNKYQDFNKNLFRNYSKSKKFILFIFEMFSTTRLILYNKNNKFQKIGKNKLTTWLTHINVFINKIFIVTIFINWSFRIFQKTLNQILKYLIFSIKK